MRKIIHCDADCFFAAVEMRDDASLRSQPLAVGGSSERRGVISTCNYEARKYGIRSAMPSWQARQLCPHLILLPHRMDKYREASQALYAIFTTYADRVEMVSLDEAYLDVSDSGHCQGSATLIAKEIREKARREVGITISAGVATNKFLAKIASDWRKPDGLFVIPPGRESAFVADLPVNLIHGVGKVTAAKMQRLGVDTCGDLRRWQLQDLVVEFGSFGSRLFNYSRGIDERDVRGERIRKSLSVEHTFATDIAERSSCDNQMLVLMKELKKRLLSLPSSYSIRKLQLKLKFANFNQTTLERPGTRPEVDIYREMLDEGLARTALPIRLMGLGVQLRHSSQTTEGRQLHLWQGEIAAAGASPHPAPSGI